MTSIAVLGPGGVGGLLAVALSASGDRVIVVASEATAAVISRDGLRLESVRLGRLSVRPLAVPVLENPVGVLLVATKATGLGAALERVHSTPSLVVPLLNGLDHMAVLRHRFGAEHVAAGTIRVESDRPQPGRVIHTSPFLRVDLATDRPAGRPALEALAGRLERAGVPAVVGDCELEILWRKLVRLCPLACATSAFAASLGAILCDPGRRVLLEQAVAETVQVARAEGVDVTPETVLAELSEAHPGLGSSMWRDLAAGREPELDAIAGAVLRAAGRHGVACATLERLVALIAERWAVRGTMAAR